jgi:hypothetical protein
MDAHTFPQRYGQIEQAYRLQEWSTVMEQGKILLTDLETQPEAEAGVKPRLQLLMAHALLYGFNDTLMAEDLYTRVAADSSESALQPMAEEGISNCKAIRAQRRENEALAQAEAAQLRNAEQEALINATPSGNGSQPATPVPGGVNPGPVMPWLAKAGGADVAPTAPAQTAANSALVTQDRAPVGETLIPDIVDEPELMELHQGESSLAEEIDLMVRDRLGVGLVELGDRNRHSIASMAPAEQAEPAKEPARAPAQPEDEDLMAGLLRVVLA